MESRTSHILTGGRTYSPLMKVATGQYAEWLQMHQFSEHLVEVRGKHLQGFVEWCDARGVGKFSQVNRGMLERYQRWLFYYRKANGKPLSVGTQFARLSSVRGFMRWASRYHLVESNPAADLMMPKMPARLPREILSPREVETIMNQPDISDALGLRDRAILEVFYSTGMRRSELCHLLLHDVDQERGTVMIREGKGRKDRMVPIGARALDWLDKYLRESRPHLLVEPDPQTLFLSRTGDPFHVDALSAIARKYIDAANIGKRGSCHLFRHSMATGMLENGADIRFIQALLGHASMETTSVYTRVAIGKLKEIHTATHPAETKTPTVVEDTRPVERAAALLDALAEEAAEETPGS